MTELIARLDDFSDRLSPILVKEVRQMVRSREFNYSFGLSLVAGLIVAFFGLADALTSIGTAGTWVFTALMVCMCLLGLVVIPLGAFSALRSERVDQTLDLITQTALSPRRIVIGKLLTQGVKLVTLFAGLSPFIVMSFLLGGVDLPTILLSLAMLFLWSMWVSAACLFLSSASQSRAMSVVLFVGMVIGAIAILINFGPYVLSALGFAGIPRPYTGVWWVLGATTALALTSMTNLVLLAENRLSLPIEDRSTALRVGFFVQFLLILACAVAPVLAAAGSAPGYLPTPASAAVERIGVFCGLQLAITAIFAVTEDMAVSRRVLRRIQWSLKRPWFAIFRPGGGRGAAWILVQMIIFLGVGAALSTESEFTGLLAICGYICFFTGLPTVVLRRVLQSRTRATHLRVGILLFFPVVGLAADFFHYFLRPSRVFGGTYSAYHILNPFRTLMNWPQVLAEGWYWGIMAMGLIGLLSYLVLIRMGQREDKHAGTAN
jgi:hypothetical protein